MELGNKTEKAFVNMSCKHLDMIKNMDGENAKAALFVALLTFELLGKETVSLYEKTTNIYLSAVKKASKGDHSVLSGA